MPTNPSNDNWTYAETTSGTMVKTFQVLDENQKVVATLEQNVQNGNAEGIERYQQMKDRAQAISALPPALRALRMALNWIPPVARTQVEQAMFQAGALEIGDEEYLLCSEPGCLVSDGTVTVCDWCQRAICLEHDDVLMNRDIDSDLTLCQTCGDIYDYQKREGELTRALELLLQAATDDAVTREERLERQANAMALLNKPDEE